MAEADPSQLVSLTVIFILLWPVPARILQPLLIVFGMAMVLSKFINSVEYYLRLTVYVAGLGTTAAFGVFSSLFMTIIGKRHNAQWLIARTFYNFVGPLVGVRINVEGREHLKICDEQSAVVIGNHQTMFDILYIGASFPKNCSIMSKKELKYTPLLGQFMVLSNAVFVDRANRSSALSTFAKVAQTMKQKGVSLFVFAEGTRHAAKVPGLLPFKKGAFHLAVEGQVPIVPMVCENYWNIYSSKEKRFKPGKITIKVLPPIPTKGYTSSSADIAALTMKTRNAMLDALEELAKREDSVSGSKEIEREALQTVAQ